MNPPTPEEVAQVTEFLGRAPEGDFTIVVRRPNGDPVVVENAPYLRDGRPMPTRHWLVDPELRAAVARLESAGGVNRAEAEVDPDELARAHAAMETSRAALLGPDDGRPRPSGGVAGTRVGVKCLHAHLAQYLLDDVDPVGSWTDAALAEHGCNLSSLGLRRG